MITGASRGLGFETAKILAARGDLVILNGRDPKRVREAEQQVRVAKDAATLTLTADVADVSFAPKLNLLLKKTGLDRLDCVIHCAAINHMGSISEITPQNAAQTMRVNACAVIGLIQAVEPWLKKADAPRFVLVSSLMKYFPMPGRSVYAASKAAAEQYAGAWQLELEAHKIPIQVQVFRPAGIETDFHHNTPTDGHAPRSDISRMSAAESARYLADFSLSAQRELAPGLQNKIVAFVARHFPGITRRILLRRYKRHL